MRRLLAPTLLALFALFALGETPSPTSAEIMRQPSLFVAPSGSDSTCARGDRTRPCRSLSRALELANSGDTALVADGTYGDQELSYADSPYGRTGSTSRVTFRAEHRHGARLGAIELGNNSHTSSGRPASYVTFDGLDFDQMILNYGDVSSGARGTFGTRIVITNAKVLSRTENGLDLRVPKNLVVRNVEIGPQCCNADAGIIVGSTYRNGSAYMADGVTLDHVYIHDVAGDSDSGRGGCADIPSSKWPNCSSEASPNTGNHTDCFQWGKGGWNITISNSRFYNCHENNMGVNDVDSGKEWLENVTFQNNMFVNSKLYDLHLSAGTSSSGGFPAVRGTIAFLQNTWSHTPSVRDVATNSKVVYQGNIFTSRPSRCQTGVGVSDYNGKAAIDSSYNMYSDGTCGPGDFVGRAKLVSTTRGSEDGHLQAGSGGIGRGNPGAGPRVDIDGHLRPLRMRPDVGASQRESASIVFGRSIGNVVLGGRKTDVVGFYGRPPRDVGASNHGRQVVRASYGIHRGRLIVTYAGDRVVGVSTSSPFYSTGKGLGVGVELPRGNSARLGCRVFRNANGAKVHVWKSRKGSIKKLSMFVRGYDSCPAR